MDFQYMKDNGMYGCLIELLKGYDNEQVAEKLEEAWKCNNYNFVNLVLDSGRDLNSMLSLACAKNYPHTAKLMIREGADVHMTKDLPLRYACKFNNFAIAKCLLENGADVHAKSDQALGRACKNNNLDLIKLLLRYGAHIYKETIEDVREFGWNPEECLKALLFVENLETFFACVQNEHFLDENTFHTEPIVYKNINFWDYEDMDPWRDEDYFSEDYNTEEYSDSE